MDTVEQYERGIEEVYGPPPAKRLRPDPVSPAQLTMDPIAPQHRSDPEELEASPQPTVEETPPTIPQDQSPALTELVPVTEADTPPDQAVPAANPVPVTQEEAEDDSDSESVHSADADLDDHQVSPESVDTHLHNLAGDVDDVVDLFDSFVGHEFREGALFLQALWKTNELSWLSFNDCKEDLPYDTAQYVLANKIGGPTGTTYSTGPHQRWARTFLQKSARVLADSFVTMATKSQCVNLKCSGIQRSMPPIILNTPEFSPSPLRVESLAELNLVGLDVLYRLNSASRFLAP